MHERFVLEGFTCGTGRDNSTNKGNYICQWRVSAFLRWVFRFGSYLVDPASNHMLVSKIKPCMSKYK